MSTNYSTDYKNLNSLKKMIIALPILVAVSIITIYIPYINFFAPYILITISVILEISIAVKILATKWQCPSINDKKILWGILAIIILPLIAPIIFYISSKNDLKSYSNTEVKQENNFSSGESSNNEKTSLIEERINMVKKLEKDGVLTKEEANEKIKDIISGI